MVDRPAFSPFETYPHTRKIESRWSDNDIYGHVNNVIYYSYMDSVVNAMLIEKGVLDIHGGDVIGLVVETGCRYAKALSYPQTIEAGIGVARLGTSSVGYQIALRAVGDTDIAAQGHFTHVYVDRDSRRPTPLPYQMRTVLEPLVL